MDYLDATMPKAVKLID